MSSRRCTHPLCGGLGSGSVADLPWGHPDRRSAFEEKEHEDLGSWILINKSGHIYVYRDSVKEGG